MAYADIAVYDNITSVVAGIYDLEHNRNQYDRIVIDLFKRSGTSGSWTHVGQGNYNPPTETYNFQTHTFTNQDIQWYYYCEVNRNYQGTWETFTSDVKQMPKQQQSAPPDPSISSRGYTWIQLNSISGNTTPEYRIEGGSYGTGRDFDGLSHGTSYWFYQRFSETDLYERSPASSALLSTSTLTVGDPSNAIISQSDPVQHWVDISWTGGSNATSHEVQWSNTTTMPQEPQFQNQQSTSYTNIDVDSFGNKHFQVQAIRTVEGQTVESGWVNFSPYPINVTESPQYNTVKVYIGGSWQSKPVKYHNGHTWVQGNIKYHDGSVWK